MKHSFVYMGLGAALIFQTGAVSVLADDDAIMDVDDNAAAFTGTWPQSTNKILYYGDDYQYAWGSGSGTTTAEAVWTTARVADINGLYEVYARWTTAPNREETAWYRVYNGIGDATVDCSCQLNQTLNGGAWQYCCTTSLSAGQKGVVKLGNENTDTNEVVVADGVRFVRTSKDGADIVDASLTGTDVANGSLYDTDMGDEAGLEYDNDGSGGSSLNNTHQVKGSIIVTAPTSGYVFAISTGDIQCTTAGAFAEVTIKNATTGVNLADVDMHAVGSNEMSYAVSGVFSVGSGSDTIQLTARCSTGTGTIEVVGFTAMFFPTRY